MSASEHPYAGTRGTGPYRGVIRVGKKIVWTCEHWHDNRDRDVVNVRQWLGDHRTAARSVKLSARGCAREELQRRAHA